MWRVRSNVVGRSVAELSPKGRRTRRQIERVALELFDERGFDDVTVTEIAAAAGVSRRLVSHYFASKRDILFGDSDEELSRFVSVLYTVDTPSLSDAWVEALTRFMQTVERDEVDLLRVRVLRTHPEVAALADQWEAGLRRAMGEWVASRLGADADSFDVRVIASALCGVRRVIVEELDQTSGRADATSLAKRTAELVTYTV